MRFITSLVTALRILRIPKTQAISAVDYTEATVEWQQWAVEDSDTVEDSEAAGDSINGCSLSCSTVDELTNLELST